MRFNSIGRTALLILLAGVPQPSPAQDSETLHVKVDPSRTGVEIGDDFIGLSYEKDILTQPRVFTPENTVLRNLFSNLGHGNLRIGAGAVEYTGWTRQPRTATTDNKTVTADDLDRFYAFVKATGWNVVHGLNWRTSDPIVAADEAEYAASRGGNSIFAFEIGNEPDLRGPKFTVQDYLTDFRSFAVAIRQRVPGAHFVGPSGSYFPSNNIQYLTRGIDEWTVPFADMAGKEIIELTHHIYPLAHPYSTEPEETYAASIPALLGPAARDSYIGTLEKLEKASEKNGIPYRISETNSCNHGGKDGVSNTFASALWGADYLFTLASYGACGLNLHSGTQFYTPIDTRESEKAKARPLYYALLLFHACGTGRIIPAIAEEGDKLQVSTYAVLARNGAISVAIINREQVKNVTVLLDVTRYFDTGRVLRMEGSSLTAMASTEFSGDYLQPGLPKPKGNSSATADVTFGGASVAPDGTWKAVSNEVVSREGRIFTVKVPSGSAVVVKFDKHVE